MRSSHVAFWEGRRRQACEAQARHAGSGGDVRIPRDDPASVWPRLTPEQRRSFLEAVSVDPDWRAIVDQVERIEQRANGKR